MPQFSKEEKIYAIKRWLEKKESCRSIAISMGIGYATFQTWIRNYEVNGLSAFERNGNRQYSKQEKYEAVKFYLDGKGSMADTCKEFKIPSHSALHRWIKLYNGCELNASPGGGKSRVMTNGRKTTLEERIKIVEDHIKTGNSYDETAQKYSISYQQIYQWYHKYLEKGIDGLKDGRGRTKPTEEMSEIEKLKAENRLLKAQLENKDLENLFLKKVKEIERRRF